MNVEQRLFWQTAKKWKKETIGIQKNKQDISVGQCCGGYFHQGYWFCSWLHLFSVELACSLWENMWPDSPNTRFMG